MSKSTDSQSESQQDDSRLREFLRRASPILAAERGWNERSQLKIKSLAEDLRLPDHLYDIAVERLQRGELQFEERFTTYERAFLKYLQKQFHKSGSTVLTAAHETRAIRIARREYEISQARARQLVRQVAEQMGMSRVSKLDAVEYVAAAIDEQIGNSTYVPDEVRGRIYQASKKWGVESAQVEILISNRIEANRQTSAVKNSWKVQVMAAFISLLIMLGLVWAAQKFISGTMNGDDPGETNSEAGNAGTVAQPVFTPTPRWWSSDTARQFGSFTTDHRSASFPHELLKSDRDDDRLLGYQAIVDLVSTENRDFSKQCGELFASFYMEESQTVCRKMSVMIQTAGQLPVAKLPAHLRGFSRTWRAVDLLVACKRLPITENKVTLLDDVSQKITGVSVRHPEFEASMKQSISDAQYLFLKTQSHAEPELAAKLIDQLGDLTRQELGQQNPLEYTTAVNLLAIRPGVWNTMRRTLERIIESATNDQLRFLYLMKNKSGIPEFQSWMGTRLANRLGIATERLTSLRIDEALEKSLDLSTSRADGLGQRWQRLMDHRDVQKLRDDSLPAAPQSIGNAVHFATIALLLSQAEKTGHPGLLERADQLYTEGPRNLAVRTGTAPDNLPVYRRIQRRALPSDFRAMEEALQKLADPAAQSDQGNATAFERLARAAPRIRDVPWEQALQLARYMLEANRTSELVAIEKHCSQMRHWPNLALALAWQITESAGSIDQALTCCSTMLGFQPQLTGENWRPQLRNLVLQRVAIGLQHTAEIQGHDPRYQWNELRSLLVEHYRIRCATLGVPGAEFSAAVSPAELAELFVSAISASGDDAIASRIESNRFLAANEMQLFVLHSSVAADSIHGSSADAAKQTETSSNLATAILQNEIRLLERLAGGFE